jgi:opacity protein-like surface antigen
MFRIWLRLFLAYISLFQIADADEKDLREWKEKIEEMRLSLSGIGKKIDALKMDLSVDVQPTPILFTKESQKAYKKAEDYITDNAFSQSRNSTKNITGGKSDLIGFYVLPFIGVLTSENLNWKSIVGDLEIDEELGLSTGLLIGYEGRNFFSDIQVFYLQNRMKSISLPLSFSGESKGVGVYLSGGGKFHLNQFISYSIGAGVGGVSQDMSFSLSGISVKEKDFVMSYQLFSGVEFRPVDYISIGLRYRWINIEEMKLFSDHYLHLLELRLGFLF